MTTTGDTAPPTGFSATTMPSDTLERLDLSSLSLRDALDLAILIEDEACERYEEFTGIVGERYPGDAADMFKVMASAEAKHRAQLSDRRKKLFGDAPCRLTRDMLDDVEAPDMGKPRVFMSARQAMEVALASEQKAYDFFTRAIAAVPDGEVKKLFEELRAEEVQHQKFVKERLDKLPTGPDLEEDEVDEPGTDPGN